MDQTTESLHASVAQLMAEVKGLAACVTSLSDMEAEHIEKVDQILTRTDVLKAQMNKFEGIVNQGIGARASRSSGVSRGDVRGEEVIKWDGGHTL